MTAGQPEWVIREDAAAPVLVALYLRQVLGIRSPEELPSLRRVPPAPPTKRSDAAQSELERQWRAYWAMTVEPQAHPSPVPLDLVEGFDALVTLPVEGAEALREAVAPFADDATDFAQHAHTRYARERRRHDPGCRTAPMRARSRRTSGSSAGARTRSS